MMTLEEMKLAVCEKLSELIAVIPHGPHHYFIWRDKSGFAVGGIVHWPTEGLQVCHEAEKLLTPKQQSEYVMELDCTNQEACGEYFPNINATYEQRLEALCRVWFPERFNR